MPSCFHLPMLPVVVPKSLLGPGFHSVQHSIAEWTHGWMRGSRKGDSSCGWVFGKASYQEGYQVPGQRLQHPQLGRGTEQPGPAAGGLRQHPRVLPGLCGSKGLCLFVSFKFINFNLISQQLIFTSNISHLLRTELRSQELVALIGTCQNMAQQRLT